MSLFSMKNPSEGTVGLSETGYPAHTVDLIDHIGDGRRNKRPPVTTFGDPPADLGPGVDRAVVERGRLDVETRFGEETLGERVVAVDVHERGAHGHDMRDPDTVSVEVLDGHDGIIIDAFGLQRLLDHQIPLTGGEGIVHRVGVLRASDTDGEVFGLAGTFADDLHMS